MRRWLLWCLLPLSLSAVEPANASGGALSNAGPKELRSLKVPDQYQLVENRNLAGAYDQTNCLDINRKTTGDHLGVVCTSSSAEFLKDMGVIDVGTQAGSEPLSQEWGTGLVVATPMAQYKLVQSTWARPGTLSAEVDCDTVGESIYRSTATCRVTIARDGKGRLTYSSIVVQDHVKKKAGLPSGVERLLWRQLDSN
jgi:hypothetical protein